MKCEHCGQEIPPKLDMETYLARSKPRMAEIERLNQIIPFGNDGWHFTPAGQKWKRLMNEQSRDEEAAGL